MATVGESRSRSESSAPATPAGGPPADRLLLEGLRRRDEAALDAVVRGFGESLGRAAYVYLGDRHGADDVTQDTFLAAWRGARRTGPTTELRPWLFGILFNLCRRQWRTSSRRRRREERAARRRGEATTLEVETDHAGLRRALDRLGRDHREVVVLRYLGELGVEETAAALGVPVGTVKSRTHHALARLRELLGGDHP